MEQLGARPGPWLTVDQLLPIPPTPRPRASTMRKRSEH